METNFDICIIFNVLHHINSQHGLEYTQVLLSKICKKVSILLVELGMRHEAVNPDAGKNEGKRWKWATLLPKSPLTFFDKCDNIEISHISTSEAFQEAFGANHHRPIYKITNTDTILK